MSSQINLPRILQIGAKASQEVGNILRGLNYNNPLIITDNMMVKLGYTKKIQETIKSSGINSDIDVFEDTIPEPTVESIQLGVEKVKNGNYDCIIALGGGSPMDSAKAISILGKYGGIMRDYKFPRIVSEPGIPIIAIPTTAAVSYTHLTLPTKA